MIGSLSSLRQIIRISRGARPCLIVIDDLALGSKPEEALKSVKAALHDQARVLRTNVLVVSDDKSLAKILSPDVATVRHDADAFELTQAINALTSEREQTSSSDNDERVTCYGLTLNWNRFALQFEGSEESQTLPLKEARLLRFFLENPGVCFSRDDIMQMVWNDVKVAARTIDSHVSRLRKRISDSPATIESVYGDGYRLAVR